MMKQLSNHLCECGCGRFTNYSLVNSKKRLLIKNSPFRFYKGHNGKIHAGPDVSEGFGYCNKCKIIKDKKEFYPNRGRSKNIQSSCILCDKNKVHYPNYLLNYGISIKEYERKADQQNNLCAICQKPETRKYRNKPKRLSVDHDHETGVTRDLLCGKCNTILGFANEDVTILLQAVRYLQNHKGVTTLSA